ncbi:regulator of G-protein signaling 9-binding protein [Alligator mississippiensis]|uniref:Regulator of G-protein signaling 9-binding protein-like n=1 Tax=Alligator mississippiensis TaxID=8496 RepID=A0A151PFQ3_ALLMI|nr:regulator of G-protein signaling 9-binding protein [Alligator mississippiensis]KYO47921.1 regulator of G-protein signaling 9-binding protein-like [Alligator mississippiensis]
MASRAPVGECAAAHAALGRVTARHRQLALLLGSAADCAQLREELQERGKEAQELGTGLRQQLEAGLRPVPGPEEQLELERLWVQLLSALELFQQDLRRAHHLSQLFPLQGRGPQPLRTGIAGRGGAGAARSWRRASRKGGRILGAEQAGAGPGLEERVAQVGAMLTEMETSLNIPVWTVEATEAAWAERSSAAEAEAEGVGGEMPGGMEAPGHCCTVS